MADSLKDYFKLPVKFRYVFYVFLALNIILMIQDYTNDTILNPQKSYAFYYSIVWVTSVFIAWLLLTPLLYRISQQVLSRKLNANLVLKQFAIALPVALLHSLLVIIFRYCMIFLRDLEWYNPLATHRLPEFIFITFSSLIQYFALLAVFIGIDYYKRYQEKINELNKAQLSTLKMQLNPHFLFNTLHTISSLMGKNNQGQKVLSRLGDLLRTMLDENQRMTITLEEELNYLKNYLYIEEVRFQDRLTVTYEIEAGTELFQVPNLILQPLVENAIKHGFSQKTDHSHIRLISHLSDNQLVLQIIDDGIGFINQKSANGNGIGLKNVRERLNKMYPGEAFFSIASENGRGCIAEIRLPAKSMEVK
ncbi:MAG: histidine kinase [Calditrichaeota bacterium]|nr:histidine kinase [Calditrichota bacterium]